MPYLNIVLKNPCIFTLVLCFRPNIKQIYSWSCLSVFINAKSNWILGFFFKQSKLNLFKCMHFNTLNRLQSTYLISLFNLKIIRLFTTIILKTCKEDYDIYIFCVLVAKRLCFERKSRLQLCNRVHLIWVPSCPIQ